MTASKGRIMNVLLKCMDLPYSLRVIYEPCHAKTGQILVWFMPHNSFLCIAIIVGHISQQYTLRSELLTWNI